MNGNDSHYRTQPEKRLPLAILMAGLALIAGVLAGCGDDAADTTVADAGTTGDRPAVIATTTVLGDVASQVVGDAGTVEVLLPIGADPHGYQASAQQAAAVVEADLVVANGLGLEEGLHDVLESAAADGATVLEVTTLIEPIPFGGEGHDHDDEGEGHDHDDEGDGHDHGHDHGEYDPHIWFDPLRMADVAMGIAAALEESHPGGGWTERAEAYAADLAEADRQIVEILSAVPEENRNLVTSHGSFGYFADRYGFETVGTVIPGGSTLADPSSAELAALVTVILEEGVRAIFGETTDPSALVDAVAGEVGEDIAVVELYTGSLGPAGSGAETLIDMLLSNARAIAEALG
jgi:zinc/manganese transport system substrate-binding protein